MSFIVQKQGGTSVKVDAIGTATTVDTDYLVSGYSSDVLAQAAFDTYIRSYLTISIAGRALTFTGNDLKHVECEHYEATAHYTIPTGDDGGENELPELSFNITGATVHKTHGYEVREAFPARTPRDLFYGAINVEKDSKGRLKVSGVDDEEQQLEIQASFKVPMPNDPFAFARALVNTANHTNQNVWYGFQPGEILFRGATLKGRLLEKWQMQYDFATSPNVAFVVEFKDDGPVNCFKRGFDYFWLHYESVVEDRGGGKLIIPKPVYAFSHRMKQEADFRILGIGG
jgi:hypothetical protein